MREKREKIGLRKQEQTESRVCLPQAGKDREGQSYFGDTWTGPLGKEKPGLKLLGSPATPNSCVTCGFQNKRGQPWSIKCVIPLAKDYARDWDGLAIVASPSQVDRVANPVQFVHVSLPPCANLHPA